MTAVEYPIKEKDMNEVIPQLFIGNWEAALSICKGSLQLDITHILTACNDISQNLTIEQSLNPGPSIKHKIIRVEDSHKENLISGSFLLQDGVRFIKDAIEESPDNRVLVHCVAGVSRSATFIIAYLMFAHELSRDESLVKLRQTRPYCQPNKGFWQQLYIYECILKISKRKAGHNILPMIDESKAVDSYYVCKRCTEPLFLTNQTIVHIKRKTIEDTKNLEKLSDQMNIEPSHIFCKHTHLLPTCMTWMSACEIEGKINCPKCGSKLGQYNWSGAQCQENGCNDFITPWFHIQSKVVDLKKIRSEEKRKLLKEKLRLQD